MEDAATLMVLQGLKERTRQPIERMYRASGRVARMDRTGAVVSLGDGSVITVPHRNIQTNGEIQGKTVLVTRPQMGSPSILSEVRG